MSPMGGKASGSRSPEDGVMMKGLGITSPVPTHSIISSTVMVQVSPVHRSGGSRYASRDNADASSEFVHYTVNIPPTLDKTMASASMDVSAAEEEGRCCCRGQRLQHHLHRRPQLRHARPRAQQLRRRRLAGRIREQFTVVSMPSYTFTLPRHPGQVRA
ncbi:hypothetical protein ZWY2020_053181 [Hordeum vulgare]|nr:hypothetical protein ZWY2020_053181 [Hordeum vulgare]